MPRPPTVSRVLRLLATLYRPRARQGYQGHSPWLVSSRRLSVVLIFTLRDSSLRIKRLVKSPNPYANQQYARPVLDPCSLRTNVMSERGELKDSRLNGSRGIGGFARWEHTPLRLQRRRLPRSSACSMRRIRCQSAPIVFL